jgi:nucleoside-diphosphate-sugar epimerase
MLKDKRVLVTGSSGVIGRVLVDMLHQLGATVLGADKKDKTNKLDTRHIKLNLAFDSLKEIIAFQPQVVFHLAAEFERTEDEPDYWKVSFDNNVLLSHRLIEAVEDMPMMECFVFASSYLIYDPAAYMGMGAGALLQENDEIKPRNIVGVAKYFTERELSLVDRDGKFRAISARIYRVYGRGSRDVISRWIRSVISGKTIEVWGEANRFDYIFADDVAEGLIKLAETDAARGIINLGSGKSHSIYQVLQTVEFVVSGSLWHLKAKIKTIEKDVLIENEVANMWKFYNLTGWRAPTALEDGIKEIVKYERARL